MRRIEKLALCMVLLGIAFIAMGPACPLGEETEKNYLTTNITSGSSGETVFVPWSMAAGTETCTLALRSNGELWACGVGESGETGEGTEAAGAGGLLMYLTRCSPITFSTLACGTYHVLAIRSDGTLWGWGLNSSGQIGVGDVTDIKYSPVQISTDTDWVEIAAGDTHSLARKSNGTLYAWGENDYGQLGLGHTTTPISVTTKVGTASNWTAIAGGVQHSLAISTSGTTNQLWACGRDNSAQLGQGATSTSSTIFTQVGTDTDWAEISANAKGNFSLALKTTGTIWGWGFNTGYQLGLGHNTAAITVTTQIGVANDWSEILAGADYGTARKTNGTIWGWGKNDVGQLAQGHFDTPKQTPTLINIGTDWGVLGCGSYHTLAIKNDGTLWGWGQGENWALTTFDVHGVLLYDMAGPVLLRIDPAQE